MEKILLAQTQQNLGNLGGIGNIGLQTGGNPVTVLVQVLSTGIGLLTVLAAIYFMFNLIIGGIGIISSGGDKARNEDAKKRITNGFIGLVVTISAIFLMDITATLLGIPSILNIGAMINLISP